MLYCGNTEHQIFRYGSKPLLNAGPLCQPPLTSRVVGSVSLVSSPQKWTPSPLPNRTSGGGSSSILGPEAGYLGWSFCDFSHSLQEITMHLRTGHNRVLFHMLLHLSFICKSSLIRCYITSADGKASLGLNRIKINKNLRNGLPRRRGQEN
jgi:hypothetical protein